MKDNKTIGKIAQQCKCFKEESVNVSVVFMCGIMLLIHICVTLVEKKNAYESVSLKVTALYNFSADSAPCD